jgi:hypothetical protein
LKELSEGSLLKDIYWNLFYHYWYLEESFIASSSFFFFTYSCTLSNCFLNMSTKTFLSDWLLALFTIFRCCLIKKTCKKKYHIKHILLHCLSPTDVIKSVLEKRPNYCLLCLTVFLQVNWPWISLVFIHALGIP